MPNEQTRPKTAVPAISVSHVIKAFTDKQSLLPAWFSRGAKTKKLYAVNDVSFTIPKGETYGLLGPNGSGKSTVIRMLATLLLPDSGNVEILGRDVMEYANWVKGKINRISVEASFFKALSAKENLLYAARLYGLDHRKALEKMRSILQELNFPLDKLDDEMYTYSRGLQQKVAIARGLLTDPEVLLLDEPTTGLDPKSKRDVQGFLIRMRAEREVTILLTSHDMEEVERLCNRIAIIDKGKIVAEGTAAELKRLVQKEDVYELKTSKPEQTLAVLQGLPVIIRAYQEDGSVRFLTNDLDAALDAVTHALQRAKIHFKGMRSVVPSLEDVFVKLTGKVLSEEEEELGE